MKGSELQDSHELGAERDFGGREFYTVTQLADILQLTEMTIYRMVNRGDLPCYAIGRIKRFRHRDVDQFLESRRLPVSSPRDQGLARRPSLRKRHSGDIAL